MTIVKVGIDVSARTLDVAARFGKQIHQKVFDNESTGHQHLIRWITKRKQSTQVVLEATGTYSLGIALALDDDPKCAVMVANPRAMRNFAKAIMQRTKDDPLDSCMILDFNERMDFIPWQRPSDAALELRGISRRIRQLGEEKTGEKNRLHSKDYEGSTAEFVKNDIEVNIRHLERRSTILEEKASKLVAANPELERKFQLLVSIKGVGVISALQILAELIVLPPDMKPAQWVAFAGLDPREDRSGTSVRSGKHISKAGCKYLRAALFMPAMCASNHDPNIKAFCLKLVDQRGKKKILALVAVMRKLLHAIWGMFRYNQPFDGEKFHPLGPTPIPTSKPLPGTYAHRQALCTKGQPREQDPDLSRLDFMIAKDMAREGHSPEAIRQLLADSPHIATRKQGHLEDYLDRTVSEAFKG
jgi:transposase